jgi:hypothetical protein
MMLLIYDDTVNCRRQRRWLGNFAQKAIFNSE